MYAETNKNQCFELGGLILGPGCIFEVLMLVKSGGLVIWGVVM